MKVRVWGLNNLEKETISMGSAYNSTNIKILRKYSIVGIHTTLLMVIVITITCFAIKAALEEATDSNQGLVIRNI